MAFKLIIAGSRNFKDYELLCAKCDHALYRKSEVEIVSGHAEGADKLGERYAMERGCKFRLFPADWEAHGKSAGYKRNLEMAKYADAAMVFWDGKSTGSKHMIDIAEKNCLLLRVVWF